MKTLADIVVDHKTVLVRVDYNVPVDDAGEVTDPSRIHETKPTIDYLRSKGCKVILLAHFGRPKGQVNDKYRFKKIVPVISQTLQTPVQYVEEAIGGVVQARVTALLPGEILLLENIRFYPGEEKNDPSFAQQLAKLGQVYINDAFGAAHRAHASTAGVAQYLPHAAGLLMQREVEELTKVVTQPQAPVVAVIGGSKISTKIALINNLLPKVDHLLLGGALANTILLAQGYEVGQSLVEADLVALVKNTISEKLVTPIDVMVAQAVAPTAPHRIVAVDQVTAADYIVDIGPKTVELYQTKIKQARTILWNGPMGVFEMPVFAQGTFGIAQAVADSAAYSVLGGGETVSAIKQLHLENNVSFVSTGGGAMLEFLEGKQLPGIIALN